MTERSAIASITALLRRWGSGDPSAEDQLIELVYPHLRELARRQLSRERRNPTLQVTELLHEAYLKLVNVKLTDWQNRTHFFAVTSSIMRQILVDRARRRATLKHGGAVETIRLGETENTVAYREPDLLELDLALDRLADRDPGAARLVELRYFGGLTLEEAAAALRIGRTSAVQLWRHARSWLRRELSEGSAS